MFNIHLSYVKTNPCGNTTVFVLDAVERNRYGEIARRIMAVESVGAEQVGYILPSHLPGISLRMEMMGGEFCGNASRSFAAWQILRDVLIRGKKKPMQGELLLDVSGCPEPLLAHYRAMPEEHCLHVTCGMPLPFKIIHGIDRTLGIYSLVGYEGITHVALWEHNPAKGDLPLAQTLVRTQGCDPASCGIMYVDQQTNAIRSLVHIEASGTTVWETSCGSGSCAVAAAMADKADATQTAYQIRQPGGTLTVEVTREKGALTGLTLSGPIAVTSTGILYLEDIVI